MKVFLMVLGLLVLVVGVALLMACPTMWLVNYLFTPGVLLMVFGTAKLRFLQAFALNALCGTLFKSTSTGNK